MIDFLTSFWGIVLLIVFFGGSIVVHEWGHFLAAKWRGLKIERFSFFGIGPKIFGWRGKDGVEYCLCWLPFGAYVALPQLADMRGIEGETEVDPDKLPPISYTDKMCVAFAGPLFNIIFAFVLATLVWFIGYPRHESQLTTTVGYVDEVVRVDENSTAPGPAYEAGLRAGDDILRIDGTSIDSWDDVTTAIVTGKDEDSLGDPRMSIVFERNGEAQQVTVEPVLKKNNPVSGDRHRFLGIAPKVPARVGYVVPDSPADQAGIQAGDIFLSANGVEFLSWSGFKNFIEESDGEPFTAKIERDGEVITKTLSGKKVPRQKPRIELTAPGSEQIFAEIAPVYGDDFTGDPASPQSPAELRLFPVNVDAAKAAGLRQEGRLNSINGEHPANLAEAQDLIAQAKDEIAFAYTTESGQDRELTLPATARCNLQEAVYEVQIGIAFGDVWQTSNPNPVQQINDVVDRTWATLTALVSPKSDIGLSDLSGPVGIGRVYHRIGTVFKDNEALTIWDGVRLILWLTVLININLAILNLLPIPVLDGGHMAFATVSKLMHKPLSPNLIQNVQGVFMIMLLGLMLYVLTYDSLRWAGDSQEEAQLRRQIERQELLNIDPTRGFNETPARQGE